MENSYSPNLSIKSWAEEDRPREKLLQKGKATLTDAELLGILIGSGTRTLTAVDLAKLILREYDNDLNAVARLSVKDLMKFNGIGEAKAITIVSALELGRRKKDTEPAQNPKIISSKQAYEIMKPHLLDQAQEEFWVILLRRNNELIRKERISIGGVAGTMVDPKIVFKRALEELASYIILIHNHPSGSLKPSHQDIQLTKRLKEAGRALDIPIVDHIIFTNHDFFSFADQSMM